MAIQTPQKLGIKAPQGGFKTGGWNEGRQYWGGTLSDPGVEHPSSGKPTSGKRVSKEVLRQTSVAAGLAPGAHETFISSQRNGRPQTKEAVTPYLNQLQENIFDAASKPKVKQPTVAEVKEAVTPTTGLPTLLDRGKRFEELRTEFGVAQLEESLIGIKDEIEAEFNLLRKQRGIEEGKPVALGVIAGRITEEERTAQERIDFLGRQQNRIVDELSTKYNVIGQFMTFYGEDYADAVGRYDAEFTKNMEMYKLVLGQGDKALDQWNADRAAASSNLTMFVNAVTEGNIDYSSLSPEQKMQISKLEVQAGLPVGFIASVKKDADADIIFTTSNKGVTQVGFRNADGSIRVESHGTRINGGAITDPKNIRRQFTEASEGSNFPDLVEQFATSMNLEEIYNAYANTDRGRKYGRPIEDSRVIKMVYEVARGNMTEEEALEELEGL